MFIGQYEHSIDAKGRIAVPSKFRHAITGGAVITKGLDGCVFVFPAEKWRKMAQNIGQLPLTRSSARLYSRLILSGATEVEFDKQGRIVLPSYLREFANLKSHAIVIGVYDRVEIWNKAQWKKAISKVEDKAGEIAEQLSDLGI